MEPVAYLKKMSARLRQFQKDKSLCDTVLLADDGELYAHSAILASASKFVCAFFKSTRTFDQEIRYRMSMSGCESKIVSVVLNYVYTGEFGLPDNVDRMDMVKVRQTCDIMGIDAGAVLDNFDEGLKSKHQPNHSPNKSFASTTCKDSDGRKKQQATTIPAKRRRLSSNEGTEDACAETEDGNLSDDGDIPQPDDDYMTSELPVLLPVQIKEEPLDAENGSTTLKRKKKKNDMSKYIKTASRKEAKPVDDAEEKSPDKSGSNVDDVAAKPKAQPNPYPAPFYCVDCKRGYQEEYLYDKHMTNVHDTSLTCTACDKAFNSKKIYRQHMQLHIRTPHVCEVCGKSYKTIFGMKEHQKCHSEIFPYLCQICQKGFQSELCLRQHEETHKNEKPYQCDVCGKEFRQRLTLQRHTQARHSNDRPFKCNLCSNGFVTSYQLKEHMISHQEEKTNVCSYCGQAFGYRKNLTRHILMHIGEKTHVCEVCNKGYVTKSSLKKHMKSHDRMRKASQKLEKLVPRALLKYICKICRKGFTNEAAFRQHSSEHELYSVTSGGYSASMSSERF